MKDAELDLVGVATSIGRALCTAAYWHEGRCNWVGRNPGEATEPGMPITPTVTALGPDLYAGTAGIAVFLAQLFARTQLEEARVTARGATLQALSKGNDSQGELPHGFYSGLVGIAYAAARVGILTDDPQLVEDGLQLACRTATGRDESNLLDVMAGHAGVIAPLLWLARLPGAEQLHEAALAGAEELANAATRNRGAWCWENDRASGPGIGPTPLCGLAHGASGMGLALIEIGVHSDRDDLIEGGLGAFVYEDRLYDDDHENWPDLRDLGSRSADPRAAKRPSFMIAWCHGAAGIGLARLRAARLLPHRRAELELGMERAIHATAQHLRGLPSEVDMTPCHGRAGIAETLLYATQVLGDRKYAEQVKRQWRPLLHAHEADMSWPCGVASGRNNPSLMLGYAGIGYGLLRADDPRSTPSLLVVEGCDRRPSRRN
jgi:lantibiotic biosynthesis protein